MKSLSRNTKPTQDGDLDKLDALIHKSVEKKQDATPAKKKAP